MTCHDKVPYRSSALALAEMKQIVWRNSVEGEGGKSKGLNVYRCRCGAWHIGHRFQDGNENGSGNAQKVVEP